MTTVLKGQAQVDFMPSALTGVLFSVALFLAGWEYALYGLAGTAVGTATAHLLGVERGRIAAGLEGFNACLVALGSAVLLGPDRPATVVVALVACVLVTVVTGAVARVLGTWALPTLTLPFCLTATGIALAAPGLPRVWPHGAEVAALPRPVGGGAAPDLTDLWHAFFANVGQIFFMPQWYVGLVFLVGIFAADRRAGALACVGSVTGTLTAWALGVPADQIASGVPGYNSVLVAMALCGVFLIADRWSLAYAVLGSAAATAATPALGSFFAPSGGHAFTWPFVLVTLLFLAAAPAFPRLRTPLPAPAPSDTHPDGAAAP
ncbi:urea transporter [Streptomyces sp. NPDC003077]|uniref:urea transporter n=1 Tax=Streptomyces sp. NPDC003077 TaxID=3154443 RepID=UPI0033A42081